MKFNAIHLTGTAGFVGTCLREFLVTRGYEVIGYDYQFSSNENLHPNEIFSKLEQMSETKQLIIHLGAVASTSSLKAHLIQERNIEFTEKLANHTAKNNIPLIFASSAAVYGVDMNVSRELEPKNLYGISKLESEQALCEQYKDSFGDLLILRLFNVFGEGEMKKEEMMSIPSRFIIDAIKLQKIQIWKNDSVNNQSRDFIYVRDLAEIICRLVEEHPWSESCIDVGTGNSVKFEYVAELLSKMGEIKTEFSNFPSHIEPQSYQHFTRANTQRLFRMIGVFKFKTLEECLKSMWQHYYDLTTIVE